MINSKKGSKKELDEFSLGVIYSLKRGDKENLINFLTEYTGCPKETFSDRKLYDILVTVFKSYFETADKPRLDLFNFFSGLHVTNPFIGNQEEQEIVRKYVMNGIIGSLQFAQVKDKNKKTGEYEYVNGFIPITDELKSLIQNSTVDN